MNNLSSNNYLGGIKELMQKFDEQVGAFKGQYVLNSRDLDRDHSLSTLALKYDNCVLNIDLVTNNTTRNQYVNHFELV
jgi:hypothetical protein